MNKKILVAIFLISLLMVSACSSQEEEPSTGLEGVNDQVVEHVVETTENNIANELGSDFSGNLLYTYNNDLYSRDQFTLAEPVLIAEEVDTEHLYFTPDRTSIVYGVWPTNPNQGPIIHRTNLQTYENYKLAEFGWRYNDIQWVANSWSPDGEWVVVTGDGFPLGIGVVRADGAYLRQVTEQRRNLVMWLTDNRLLVINREWVGTESTPTLTHIEVLSPAENSREVISIPEEYAQSAAGVYAFIQEAKFNPINPKLINDSLFDDYDPQIIGMPEPTDDVVLAARPLPENPNRYCGNWEIYQASTIVAENETPDIDILHTFENVGAITDVQSMTDGSLVFIRWQFPDCEFLQPPSGELVYLQTDGTEVVIGNDLARLSDRNQILQGNAYEFHRYAIAPDEKSVAWISSSEDGRNTALHVTNLTSFETVDVENAINQEVGFKTVYWLATS